MDTKLLDQIQRAIFVVIALTIIFILFAPKSYGQFSRPVWTPKPKPCEVRYRWAEKGMRYQEVKDDSVKQSVKSYLATGHKINDNPKDPLSIKVGGQEYIVWRKKIYLYTKTK